MTRELKCRACGAGIMFLRTLNGKTMPVDMEPRYFVPDLNGPGLYVMPDGTVIRGARPMAGDKDRHVGYISHFATCTNPEYFRKARKKDRKGGAE